MKKSPEGRSPFDRAAPLRVPGQSLEAEIGDVEYDHILTPLLLALHDEHEVKSMVIYRGCGVNLRLCRLPGRAYSAAPASAAPGA